MIDIKIAIVSLFGPLFHGVIYLNLNSNINKKMYNYHLFFAHVFISKSGFVSGEPEVHILSDVQ